MNIQQICQLILTKGGYKIFYRAGSLHGDHSKFYFKMNDGFTFGGFEYIEIEFKEYDITFSAKDNYVTIRKEGYLFFKEDISKSEVENIIEGYKDNEAENKALILKQFELELKQMS